MAKKKNSVKRANKTQSFDYKEHITNRYMIQLSFGILGIILLLMFGKFYKTPSILVHMQTITYVMTAIFCVACLVMLYFGKKKDSSRLCNYSVLMIVCGGVTLWLSVFNKVRPMIQNVLRTISGNELLSVNSYWNVRVPIVLIVAYLVVAFVIYYIRLGRKRK